MRDPSFSRRILAISFLVLLIFAAARLFVWKGGSPSSDVTKQVNEIARQVADIESKERKAAATVWADELLAERCGRRFEQLWNAINAATNQLNVLTQCAVDQIIVPKFGAPKGLGHGIELFESVGSSVWNASTWRSFLSELELEGWALKQTEFRHIQFDTDGHGRPRQSRFYFSAHLLHQSEPRRAILEGTFLVDWHPSLDPSQPPALQRIDASALTLKTRMGDPTFHQVLNETVAPPESSFFIDPLILYDLDGDGHSEIVLAAKNLVFQQRPDRTFESRPLCQFPPTPIFSGLLADFDGDGIADFLCARFEGLYLFHGSPNGKFDEPGRQVWGANPHLKYAQALTCGDIDGDGDLDVWLGQYKLPYDRGQMPTPYFDANDGYPSYLLLNDGRGNFTDGTMRAGLSQKRWRRVYSASLVDLQGKGHLDLVVASDFAGLELFANDGQGHFTDVSKTSFPEAHGFGMSQLCSDFDGDGRLDLLMIGMNVPVMDRLGHLGRSRTGFESFMSMGPAMTAGNRLFLAQSAGGYQQTRSNQSLARTGWSWGAAAFDYDNDGFPDLYIANGHETKQSVQDYETEFWLHDIYVGNSRDDLGAFAYFKSKQARTRGGSMSYGGYEKNRFFLNQGGESFLECAYLMGVALEQDSRNVVADDLDGDGRMDLLVTTFEAWPEIKQTLRVFQNTIEDPGNWIGFRFREHAGKTSPVGVRVILTSNGHSTVQEIVAGDGYRSQRANVLHFGLGSTKQVDRAEISWPNGRSIVLKSPGINQYHMIEAGSKIADGP